MKTTRYKINKFNNTPVIKQETNYNYNTIKIPDEIDNKLVEKLLSNIDKLDINDHKNIYLLLRTNGINKDYFSHNSKGVYFDFFNLPAKLQKELYIYVELSIENKKRNEYIEKIIAE